MLRFGCMVQRLIVFAPKGMTNFRWNGYLDATCIDLPPGIIFNAAVLVKSELTKCSKN